MSGRLAIDFGTSNTVLAVWDPERREGIPLHIPDYGLRSQQGDEEVTVVPSLIHYAADQRRWIGNQVIEKGLNNSPRTFRWMKQYINNRSPIKIRIDDREVTPFTAGRDFLTSVLAIASQEIELKNEEVALSVPVEAYEHYENWLTGVAESAGILRFRLIDEPSAAALGYGAHIQPGNVYLIFDFGGGTLHASVILMESQESALTGKRCRVLGKAGKTLGGSRLDQWLFQEILRRNQHLDSDDDIRPVSTALLVECERLKVQLSFQDSAAIPPIPLAGGGALQAAFTRGEFEDLLDQNDLFADINQTVRTAINHARERGYSEEDIQAVLMVGGSSQIPAVQRTLRQFFGKEKVFSNRPLDAVARGAAAFVAGVDFYDHIQHDYAIRYVNPEKGSYDYRVLVHRGTSYPTPDPVARLNIKASYDGQRQLGIAIYEMGQQRASETPSVELVFDPGGAARLVQLSANEQQERSLFWMNENSPTFLAAEPPGKAGEPRFEVEFYVDANKRLTLVARDLQNNRLILDKTPVVKLT
ncbi:molecular chaperone [Longilinea arvoryzae]|uniref:Molecular chaperone n=1 Tax=Longilinea arvoryzae TaxID=360412 RepID=A0A0S7BJB1_9CHLR|nr:Hsp70 family protein [Longilinea arvoryzae]GAP14550.1 molecular chaperone [Longilinea arvoryzae]